MIQYIKIIQYIIIFICLVKWNSQYVMGHFDIYKIPTQFLCALGRMKMLIMSCCCVVKIWPMFVQRIHYNHTELEGKFGVRLFLSGAYFLWNTLLVWQEHFITKSIQKLLLLCLLFLLFSLQRCQSHKKVLRYFLILPISIFSF